MTQKILLTGSAGFVGKALTSHLKNHGHNVYAPTYDLLLESSLHDIQKKGPWEVTIHLAGISDVATCEAEPEKATRVNVGITEQLAQAISRQGSKAHFIFASSGLVYKQDGQILTEESPIEPQNFYAKTKYAAENVLFEISKKEKLPVSVLRLFNHTHCTQDPRFFLPFIYQEILKIKNGQGNPAIVTGNVHVRRDIGLIQDLLKAFQQLVPMPPNHSFHIFNVCSGQARQMGTLALELSRQMQVPITFELDPAKVRKEADTVMGSYKKIRDHVGWQPELVSDEKFVHRFLEKLPGIN